MVAINNATNNTIGASNTGATNTLTVSNSSDTSSSAAVLNVSVGGSTAADPQVTYTVTGLTSWCHGIDNSVTSPADDPLVFSNGTALGTNNVISAATSGEINYPLQPAFLVTSGGETDVTGTGATYTLVFANEIFDQNNDFDGTSTFTAPITGRYHIELTIASSGYLVSTRSNNQIVTSNRSYFQAQSPFSCQNTVSGFSYSGGCLCDMDAADTAVAKIICTDEATADVDILANKTTFSGYLNC